MVDKLKETQFVNGFLIVFNGQNPRFDEHLQTMLKLFKNMFGDSFFKNTAFLFTRWSMAKKDVNSRLRAKDTEADKKIGFNKLLKENGLFDTAEWSLPCFFIDNTLNDEEGFQDATKIEQEAFVNVRNDIRQWLVELPQF